MTTDGWPSGARRRKGFQTDPERFFRPPYVGHRGWLGVQLAHVSAAELNAICREAFCVVAPPTVQKRFA